MQEHVCSAAAPLPPTTLECIVRWQGPCVPECGVHCPAVPHWRPLPKCGVHGRAMPHWRPLPECGVHCPAVPHWAMSGSCQVLGGGTQQALGTITRADTKISWVSQKAAPSVTRLSEGS